MNKTVSNFLIGFLAGAAAGAIAGVLFAPDKGSTTRQNIRKKVRDLSDDFGLGLGDLIDDLDFETEPATKTHTKKASSPKSKDSGNPKRKYTRKPRTNNQEPMTSDQ